MGELTILKAIKSGALFFHCEACGCAWDRVPEPMSVNSVDPVEKFAPDGHVEATLEEIRAAGIHIAKEYWLVKIRFIAFDDQGREQPKVITLRAEDKLGLTFLQIASLKLQASILETIPVTHESEQR